MILNEEDTMSMKLGDLRQLGSFIFYPNGILLLTTADYDLQKPEAKLSILKTLEVLILEERNKASKELIKANSEKEVTHNEERN